MYNCENAQNRIHYRYSIQLYHSIECASNWWSWYASVSFESIWLEKTSFRYESVKSRESRNEFNWKYYNVRDAIVILSFETEQREEEKKAHSTRVIHRKACKLWFDALARNHMEKWLAPPCQVANQAQIYCEYKLM